MPSRFAIEVIESAAALEALSDDWWALWRRALHATPFQTPAWLIPWWKTFSPGRLATVAVRQGRRLVGLAPCYVEEAPCGPRLLFLGLSVSDHLDVLIDPSDADAVTQALADALAHEIAWVSCEFAELGADANALALPCPKACGERLSDQSACPILSWSVCKDGLPQSISAEQRRKLRRAARRAAARGATQIHAVREHETADFLEILAALHAARWKEQGESGVLTDHRVLAFHAEALERMVSAGLARLYLCVIGERPASAYYGFSHGPRAYAYIGGFDPAFRDESPGALILAHAIAEAAAEGVQEFDFLRGQEPYKYRWGARDCWNRYRCFRRAA